MQAKVIVEVSAKSVDKEFVYGIPAFLIDLVNVGVRVKIPFGNRVIEGFVMEVSDEFECEYDIKDIIEVIDKDCILNEEMLWLGKEISDSTLCSMISAYQVMLPRALKASVNTSVRIKNTRYIVPSGNIEEYLVNCKYDGQRDILTKLIRDKRILVTSTSSSINTLIKKGLIKYEYEEEYRYHANSFSSDKKLILNEEQINVINEVSSGFGTSTTYLLYGVTGSGKTEVYMNLINQVIDKGMSAIVLVPEISLTTQIVSRFISRFGNTVAVLHSGLSDGEKYDEYRKIRKGLVSIVIGARSAIFAPLSNLGIIVIDEEHTSSYKQDSSPKYNAKDVAILRSKYHKCPVILGSATPSLESFAKAGNRVYKLLTMMKRAGNGKLPDVNIVDMKKEAKNGNFILSSLLINKINSHLMLGNQVILLLNRRGYSSMFTCVDCGNVSKCPNCDISLTYHKSSNRLTCHYCNYSIFRSDVCSKCGSSNIKDYGVGTEKLVEEVSKIIPRANIVRMDLDTTSKKGSHEKIIKDFSEGKYNVLIGTQMIAKGLDFPNVTLVGVISADSSLNIPDFRSSERTYQLISQVSGRAGRDSDKGEVIIQTFNDKHYSLLYSSKHDYLGFYKEEMKIRKELKYSPYYYITLVNITSSSYELGFEEAKRVGTYLRNKLSKDSIVLGPSMANVFRVNNIYRYQCIIKYRNDSKLKEVLKFLDERYKSESKVNIDIDVNPNKL